MNRYLIFSLVTIAIFATATANAFDKPQRKPGLWETTVQADGRTFVSQVCADAASDAKNNATTDEYMKANCTKYEMRQDGGKWITDSVCTFAGTQKTGHTVTTAVGDNAFHTEGTSTADAKWLGPCLPRQKPGVPVMVRPSGK